MATEDTGLTDSDVQVLETGVRGAVLRPGDPEYDGARAVWNGMIDRRPAVVVRCSGVADVTAAVAFAREHGRPVSVVGGGHGVAGNALVDGGIVVDLSPMRSVLVDPEARTVRAQGGATWGDVDHETQAFGLVVPGGVVSETGIAGLTLGGGYGWTRRKWGLTCDSLVSADVVTAEGEFLTASEGENEDLLWALRGGGGGVGVVTAFEYECHPFGPEVYLLGALYPLEDGEEVMRAWREFAVDAPDEVTADAAVWSVPELPTFPEELHGTPFVGLFGMYAGEVDAGESALRPLREVAEPLLDLSGPTTYLAAQSMLDPLFPSGDRYYWKSHYLAELPDEAIETVLEHGRRRPSPRSTVPIRTLGGAIERLDADGTAFGDRSAPFLLSIDGVWSDPADDEGNVAWVREFWEAMEPYSTGSVYVNFAMGEETDRASFTENEDRLADVKARHDPENLFRAGPEEGSTR